MCLTGVDYFSTLGYQPSIAFEAAGRLAPIATLVLVIVTLGCALPVYRRVAAESPNGLGSIAMLERLVGGWPGKFLVLVLLGFAMTDFVITKTLSAADAAEHLIHNPLYSNLPAWAASQVGITMGVLVVLGAVFLRGFREVIAVAVVIVAVYLVLNFIVIGAGLTYLVQHGELVAEWFDAVRAGDWRTSDPVSAPPGWWGVVVVALLLFPKLALGLSGFETGVAVMPLVKGDATDTVARPAGRIRNARKLLLTAALIMSALLIGSSIVTSLVIDPAALQRGGIAANRALAFVAHGETKRLICPLFGELFGTMYDVSTIAILWFAGASAMSGLLNLVPRYLPRFGMAPRWAERTRPLIIMFILIDLVVTLLFRADVSAQGGAYATGVMVLMLSASVAVVIDGWKRSPPAALAIDRDAAPHGDPVAFATVMTETSEPAAEIPPAADPASTDAPGQSLGDAHPSPHGATSWVHRLRRVPWYFVLVSLVFLYTTVAIILEKPDGIKIAGGFIIAVVVFSIISRTRRSTELRFEKFEFAAPTSRFLWDAIKHLEFPVLVPHRPGRHAIADKEERIRRVHRLGSDVPIVFVEITLGDPSEFEQTPLMEVTQAEGRFVIRLSRCVSTAHALATIALELARTGRPPELHFGWSNESPLVANLGFLLFGEGNVPWLVRELIRKAEPDASRRPRIILG
jgi:hypothetical protein